MKDVRDWRNKAQKKILVLGLKHAKGFLQGPFARRTMEISKLNRN
jgi:hypothetical protein